MDRFIFLLSISFYISTCLGLTFMQVQDIFKDDICAVKCGERFHTACKNENQIVECPYKQFVSYDVDKFKSLNLKQMLINGHNGLRDRIATRMKVANMVQLAWDDALETMAGNYAKLCRPFEDDACAYLDGVLDIHDFFDTYASGKNGYLYVVQSRFCVEANFFPRDFVEKALHDWYFEKNRMQPPVHTNDESLQKILGWLYSKNNFTYLAFPLAYRFGCAIARYDNYFCIFCNYYPYYQHRNNVMIFEYGEPSSICPSYFPLKNEYFRALCTGDNEDVQESENESSGQLYINALAVFMPILLAQLLR